MVRVNACFTDIWIYIFLQGTLVGSANVFELSLTLLWIGLYSTKMQGVDQGMHC